MAREPRGRLTHPDRAEVREDPLAHVESFPGAIPNLPALEAAEIVGEKVVRDLVEHWGERESTIPHAR